MLIHVIRHSIRNRGSDRILAEYLSFLAAQGHEIEYWTNEIKTRFCLDERVVVKKIPYPGVLGTMLFTALKAFQGEIVLVDLILMANLAWRNNKGKVVYFAQDYDVTYYRWALLRWLTKRWYERGLRQRKIPVITTSDKLKETLTRYHPAWIRTVPNGVDTRVFQASSQNQFVSLKKDALVILLFARKDYRKGLDVAISALQKLNAMPFKKKWELWTIGEKVTALSGVEVKNFGFLDEKALCDILSAADIFLLPSRSEGLSTLLLQALSCACAVVATQAANILTDGEDGLISPVEAPQGFGG